MSKKTSGLFNSGYAETKQLMATHLELMEQQRYLKALILFLLFVVGGLLVSVVMVTENAKPKTFFVAISENPVFGQTYRIIPEDMPMADRQLLIRQNLITLLRAMTERDHATEEWRYGRLQRAMDDSVWNRFKGQIVASAEKFEGVRRTVDILSDVRLSEGVYQIRFRTRDYGDNAVNSENLLAENKWVATMNYVVMPHLLTDPVAKQENPLGILIRSYDLVEDK